MLKACPQVISTGRICNKISAAKATKEGRSFFQPVCLKRRESAQHRSRKAAVQLRRGDMAYTPPPWHLSYDATAEQLHTPEMIKVLDSQVWLDASLPEHAIPEDPCQLPFPPEVQAIDLGPAINDALQVSLPSANLCGRPDCNIQFAEVGGPGQTAGWSATPQRTHKSKREQNKPAGQFAALQKLKNKC